ncbi:3-epi-6-deoxocathasterone 23-monooxygenase [Acorus gramineus]|uniref:3-epi-6-deoxocathasterone 23-monooxygenase n=1 Tax=Acorus gramineus TaxID=55184 RepID=A0AAV9AF51_ACOGR|nr:3-epi-6-deoxocathasterone 23-monooxygenase [Acorus gramineus]
MDYLKMMMSWAWVGFWLLVAIVGGWYWVWWKREKERERKRGVPDGSLGWPFIGETLDFISTGQSSKPVPMCFMDKKRSLYGKVFKSHILGLPMIVSMDSEVNKAVLQNDGRSFVPYYPKTIMELFGDLSIVTMEGNLHRRVHGLVGGFLKSPALKTRFTREVEGRIRAAMAEWEVVEGGGGGGRVVHFQDVAREVTFQMLVRVLLGIEPGERYEYLKYEFHEFIKGLICLPVKFPGTRLYKSLKAKARMVKFVKSVIKDKMKRVDNESDTDVLDVLLNEMNGGKENMELKKEKMRSGEPYAWSDYMSLQFTQNVISETLRMGNIINAVWRKALKDVNIKGYVIPKGWGILTSFSSIHLDEENYENPYKFNPWRWERKEGNPLNFTPFGGGQRLCPGGDFSRLEVAIFLHHLVTRYSALAGLLQAIQVFQVMKWFKDSGEGVKIFKDEVS